MCKQGESETHKWNSLLGIGTGLRTGLALGRTSNIPPTATPPLGGPPQQKANIGYEAMGVHTNTVVILGHGFQLES